MNKFKFKVIQIPLNKLNTEYNINWWIHAIKKKDDEDDGNDSENVEMDIVKFNNDVKE